MADDDMRSTMQFILEQQAQLTATVGQLSETVGRLSETVDRFSGSVDRLTVKVDRTADGITALLAIAEIHEREIEALKDTAATNGRDIAALKEAVEADREAGRATDERLSVLINVVEQMIGERRGNGGGGPAA